MRFPSSALIVAVVLTGRGTASKAEIASEKNDRGGLRKGNRRRKLQNRSIICEAQGTCVCRIFAIFLHSFPAFQHIMCRNIHLSQIKK